MIYFSIKPTTFPEIIFAHQLTQKNYHYSFTYRNNNIEIAYIKSGPLKLSFAKQEFIVNEGSFLLLPHNCNFKLETLDANVHIHYTLALNVGPEITIIDDSQHVSSTTAGILLPLVLPPCPQTQSLFFQLNNLIDAYNTTAPHKHYQYGCRAFDLLCELSFLHNISNFSQNDSSKTKMQIYSQRIVEYIHKNINQPISLSDISVFLDKNPDYLNKLFKKEHGMSIIQYINQEKIKKCAELMTVHGYSLNQCCDIIGIKEPNYLSRLFKKHMGINASQYKQNSVYSTFPLVDRNKLEKKTNPEV